MEKKSAAPSARQFLVIPNHILHDSTRIPACDLLLVTFPSDFLPQTECLSSKIQPAIPEKIKSGNQEVLFGSTTKGLKYTCLDDPHFGAGGGRTTPNPGSRGDKIRRPPQKNTFLNDPPPGGRGDKIHSPPPKVYFLDGHYPCGNRTLRATLLFPQGMGVRPKSVFGRGGADFVAPYPRGGVGGFVQKVFGGGASDFPPLPPGVGGRPNKCIGGGWRRILSPPTAQGWGVGSSMERFFGGGAGFSPPYPPGGGGGGSAKQVYLGGEGAGFRRPLPPRGGGGVVHKNVFWGWRQIFAALHFPLAAPSAPPFFPSGACCAATFLTAPAAPQFPRRGACGAAV